MTLNPQPPWPQVHIEFFEIPGFVDDCFRSGNWIRFLAGAGGDSWTVSNNIAGDYVVESVTEGGAPAGAGWGRDISALALDTDDYPLIYCRLRGGGTTPQYRIEVEYTVGPSTDTGWTNADTDFFHWGLQLTAGKIIDTIKLYVKSNTPNGTATIDWDYVIICARPPIFPYEHFDLDVELSHTVSNSTYRFKTIKDKLDPWTERRYSFNWGTDKIQGATKGYDLSKNKHIGTYVNAAWAPGKFDRCLSFVTAMNSRFPTGYAPDIPANGAITIMFWVKAATGATGVIIGAGDPAGVWRRVQFNWSADKIRLYVRDGAANVRQCTTTDDIADNTWHHIAGVIDPENDVISLYVDGAYDTGDAGVLGQIDLSAWDFNIGCLNNGGAYGNYATAYVDEPTFLNKALSLDEILYHYLLDIPLTGVSRIPPGTLGFIYVAAHGESLVHGMIKGRIIDRVFGGEPDAPYIEFFGEDRGEIIHERTFTEEYTAATQISTVVDDIIDNSVSELYQDKDTTNRTIINKFNRDACWNLLQKLAETATFATGETGAHFWVDPGGAFKFKKYGAFTAPGTITDGSDGNTPNIINKTYKESIKETPRLINDCQVVIFEEEYNPIDQDSLTESAEGWSSPDPIDVGSPFSDAGDKQAGTASIHFNTTNPGVRLRMRISWPDFDITGFDRIKFYLKYGAGLTVDNFKVRIWRTALWVTDYLEDNNVVDQGAAAWHEYNIPIAGMAVTGNPGSIINVVQIEAVQEEAAHQMPLVRQLMDREQIE